MSSPVDTIKSKLDIADLVSAYVKLENAGSNMKGKCPFHNEKTPSFVVSPDRGTYYCFGCHAKGDIFTFVQEMEGVDFRGALKILGEKTGVPIVAQSKEERSKKDKLYSLLDHATFFFMKNLSESKEALSYVKGRGINADTIRMWKIGYALDDWRTLKKYLSEKGFSTSEMEKVGLVKPTEGRDHYDTFRDRIVFPILDVSGRVIAFSGRILHEKENAPKYLNSPETQLFDKSEILYGLDKAKHDIRTKDNTILVEGQMDLVMSHQAGFANTVATSGTSLTAKHLDRIKRLSTNILFVFDPDGAGVKAALKSAELSLAKGFDVKVARLPEDSDPASLIKDNEPLWEETLKKSSHVVEFYLEDLLSQNLDSIQLAREITNKILPFVARVPSSVEQAHFVKTIGHKAGIKEDAIWDDLKKVRVSGVLDEQGGGDDQSSQVRSTSTVLKILGLIYWQESKVDSIDVEKVRKEVVDIIGEEKLVEAEKEAEPNKDVLIFEAESYCDAGADVVLYAKELLRNIKEEVLKKQLNDSMDKLAQAERENNKELTQDILKTCQDLSKQLSDIKTGTSLDTDT